MIIISPQGPINLLLTVDNLRNLANQTAIYGISTIGARLLNFMLIPYLTRVIGIAEYGVITYMYSLVPFLLIVLTMGMETGYFNFAGKATSEAEKRNIFQTTWGAVTAVSLLFFVLVCLFFRPIAASLSYSPSYVLIIGIIIALDAICAIPFARLREQGRAMKYVSLRLISVVITVVLTVFFYSVLPALGRYDISFAPGYYMVANLMASAVTLPLLYTAYKGFRPKVDTKLLRVIFLYSMPLLISGIAGVATDFIDRQFLKFLLPEGIADAELGIYGAVTKIGVILILFVQMYRIAAEPFFLGNFAKDDFCRLNAEAMKYFVMVSVFIFLVISLYPSLFGLLVGEDFREGMSILPVVLTSNIFAGIVLNLSFWYKKSGRTNYAIIITGTGLAVSSVANVMLIPRIGYAGAAWARLACEMVMVVVSYMLMRRFYPIDYDLGRIARYFLVGAVIYCLSLFTARLPHHLDWFVNLILVSVFVYYAVKSEKIDVKQLAKSILNRK